MIEFPGEPKDWIAEHGRPAACLPFDGLAAYEHEDGKLIVMEACVVQLSAVGGVMLFPRWYGTAALIAPDGMVPLHHSPEAWWRWRPVIYNRSMHGGWRMLGSQTELAWRFGLMEVQHAIHTGSDLTIEDSNDRADALLLDCLSVQQRIEYLGTGDFRVRGASTGHTYLVTPNNGFDRIDPLTGETVVSYCLHTEHWLPDSDQALAVKYGLESVALEAEVLEGARGTEQPAPPPSTTWERHAAALETKWRLVA
jgi:hypothetical protein